MPELLSGIFGIVQVSTVAGKRKFDVRLFGLDGMSVYCLVVLFGRFLRFSGVPAASYRSREKSC
jgi:hypothetical protein